MKAAIDVLRRELESCLKTRAKNFPILSIEPERSIRQAIAVLEAAEKVDKKKALEYLYLNHDEDTPWLYQIEKSVRTLLDSLPDKLDKEGKE